MSYDPFLSPAERSIRADVDDRLRQLRRVSIALRRLEVPLRSDEVHSSSVISTLDRSSDQTDEPNPLHRLP